MYLLRRGLLRPHAVFWGAGTALNLRFHALNLAYLIEKAIIVDSFILGFLFIWTQRLPTVLRHSLKMRIVALDLLLLDVVYIFIREWRQCSSAFIYATLIQAGEGRCCLTCMVINGLVVGSVRPVLRHFFVLQSSKLLQECFLHVIQLRLNV